MRLALGELQNMYHILPKQKQDPTALPLRHRNDDPQRCLVSREVLRGLSGPVE